MSDYDPAQQATVSVPTLIIVGVLLFFTARYFYNGSSSSISSAYPSSGGNRQRGAVSWDKIETVTTMFPQLRPRDVEYDLMRNGGSVQATTETVLREGSLSAAPPSFQAQTPSTPAPSSDTAASNRNTSPQQKHSDLITRYNLSSQVSKGKGKDTSDAGPILTADAQRQKGGWSSNKNERQEILKRRREEMVLQARRRMEEKGEAP